MSARRSAPSAFLAGALASGVATAAWEAARRTAPGERWQRRNHRDRQVTLLLGPAVGAGAVAAVLATGPQARRTALVAVSTAALVGGYDDLYGDRHARGLLGHARALREGRVTTGMVKLVSMASAAAVGSAMRRRHPADLVLDTVLVAGTANLVNLFDLRPGRAAKVTLLAAAGLAASGDREARALAASAAGAALAALPADLSERAMLGDCGAGTLGTLLGLSAAAGGPRWRRSALAAVVVGLTAASERVSFSAVIERTPALRSLDRLGRQPA